MVKKKVIKKKRATRKLVSTKPKQIKSDKQKINLVLRNLILFGVLSLASFLLYSVSSDELLKNLFNLLSIVLSFVAGAFLFILLVFLFMKIIKK